MAHYAALVSQAVGHDIAYFPGAGAAGGLGAALGGVLGAKLRSGIDAVLDAVDFEEKLKGVCLAVTGEGRMDVYGSIVSGISGDHSILLAKSILDLFTAMIFACSLGMVVSAVAIPQFVIFLSLYLLARVIFPLTTPSMINDFKACGGLILLATGLRIAKIKDFPIADMIPAMLIVWPISWMWTAWIVPLI